MIISCANCGSRYSVDDSKVEGKRFGFSCPKCGDTVEIDNRERNRENHAESSRSMAGTLAGKRISKIEEQEAGLPSKDDLNEALSDLTASEESDEDGFNIEDMELPDLDGLGKLSESGDAVDDEINIPNEEEKAEGSDDFDIEIDEETDKEDLLAMVNSGKKNKSSEDEIDIFKDFNPIESESNLNNMSDEDISLSEGEEMDSDIMSEVKSDDIFSTKDKEDEDENITIDLDSLDIQLQEDVDGDAERGIEVEELSDTIEPLQSEDIEITDFESDDVEEKNELPLKEYRKMTDEDEDITLDLDALDLTLDEVEELKEGEPVDAEDERISLSDAGLTPDELFEEEVSNASAETDEDIRLSIGEVAPEVGIEKALHSGKEKITGFDEDELPEIDLDKFEEDSALENIGYEESGDIRSSRDFQEHEAEIANPDADIRDTVPEGIINFSVDYSLRFSRVGAIFRLLCLFPVVLIPHFIVLTIYSALSMVLSFFNWIIIALSGTHEENYLEIQENTIRYLLSLSACCADLVEDIPQFAGRKNIDYSLQMDVTYPIKYSRILALLRISVIGILLAALPHLILLFILTIGSIFIYIIGLFSIIIQGKWPNVQFDFMVRYYRYAANVLSFITGVIDRYPSFKFE